MEYEISLIISTGFLHHFGTDSQSEKKGKKQTKAIEFKGKHNTFQKKGYSSIFNFKYPKQNSNTTNNTKPIPKNLNLNLDQKSGNLQCT
jgi:hypothetical protein